MNPMASEKLLRQHLDNVFETYIKKRDKYACVVTGVKRNLVLRRMVDSDIFSVRYDPDNAFMVSKALSDSFDKNPEPILSWYLGHHTVEDLYALSHARRRKVTSTDIINKVNSIVGLTDPIRNRGRWDD